MPNTGYGKRKRKFQKHVDGNGFTNFDPPAKRGRKKKDTKQSEVIAKKSATASSSFVCATSSSKKYVTRNNHNLKNGRRGASNKNTTKSDKRSKNNWDNSADEDDSQSSIDIDFESSVDGSGVSDDEITEPLSNFSDQDVSAVDDVAFYPWIELEESTIQPLVLPCGSSDILIDSEHLFDLLTLYEILRRFYKTIQVSPFLFEDLCCALRSDTQSNLLCEIHIALIRLLFRDDEEEQTTFTVTDLNPSFNALSQMLEPMTFSEVLRQYLESDKKFSPQILEILQTTNYPFVDLNKRMSVLKWLCDQFLETKIFKRLIENEELFEHDRLCRFCGKPGDLLNCSGCEAAYHLLCISLKKFPDEDWFCTICNSHRAIIGRIESEIVQPLRQSPIGYDRHGRIYWFLSRRIFIQNTENKEVHYYSTLPQVHELVSQLDPRYYEIQLCKKLVILMPIIAVQMHETLELTDRRREDLQERTQHDLPQPYIHIDNVHRMSYIISRLQHAEEAELENEEDELDEDGNWTHFGIVKQVRNLLCVEEGRLVAPFWSGNMSEEHLLEYNKLLEDDALGCGGIENSSLYKDFISRAQRGYRLGFSDGEYRQYVNNYTKSELSKSYSVRSKERDRRKNLNSRFGLSDDTDSSWAPQKHEDCFGTEQDSLNYIKLSITKLVESIPDELLHRLWVQGKKKQKFLLQLNSLKTISDAKNLLLLFERVLRKPVFSTLWWNCLGHTKLLRMTVEEKERRQKLDQIKKREERTDPSDDTDLIWVKYTLIGGPPKHNIWKLKEEQFRVNGIGSLGGWIWTSSTMKRNIKSIPKKAPLNIRFGVSRSTLDTIEAKKVYRLERLVKRFTLWRIIEEYAKVRDDKKYLCYSSSCRFVCSGTLFTIRASCPSGDAILPCYSSTCIRNNWDLFATKSSEPVICKNIIRIRAQDQRTRQKEIPGEGIPFQFPKPHEFKSKRSEKRSILILPRSTLRKMARQGGLDADIFIPGFSRVAKVNSFVWPYPCIRPLFDQCWRYMTAISFSHHAIILRFKQLCFSIRWADMAPDDDDDDPRVWSHLPDYDEVRTVIGHKEHQPDGYYEQYKIRVEQYLFQDAAEDAEEDDDDSVSYSSANRTGGKLTRRKRKSKKGPMNRKVVVLERWIDGVDLKLYEIVDYWRQQFEQQKSMVAKASAMKVVPAAARRQLPPAVTPPTAFHTNKQISQPARSSIQNNYHRQLLTPLSAPQQIQSRSLHSASKPAIAQNRVLHTIQQRQLVMQPAPSPIVFQTNRVQPMIAPIQQPQQHPVVQVHQTSSNAATVVTLPEGMRFAPGTTFKFIYAPK